VWHFLCKKDIALHEIDLKIIIKIGGKVNNKNGRTPPVMHLAIIDSVKRPQWHYK